MKALDSTELRSLMHNGLKSRTANIPLSVGVGKLQSFWGFHIPTIVISRLTAFCLTSKILCKAVRML